MKLAHVTMHYFPIYGGQEVYIAALNSLLRDAGIEVSVIQPSRSKKEGKPDYVYYLSRLRIGLGRVIAGVDWFWFNLMLKANKKLLKNQDVIISHYPFHYPAISWHDNVIVLSHGLDWAEPPVKFVDKYKKYAAELAKNKNITIVGNDTCFLRSIGIDAEPSVGYFKEISKNVWFIPNCIDVSKFYNKKYKRENIILVPRNIRKARGIHLAIKAFSLFLKKHEDYTMHIVGGHLSGQYFRDCLQLVMQYGIEDKVHFAGTVPNDALVDLYNKSKITLIPTIAFEGTCISALESMACSTPVVSTKVGGLSDLPTYKVGTSAEEICIGMEEVLNSWADESERQYSQTVDTFNFNNWRAAWLKVINYTRTIS